MSNARPVRRMLVAAVSAVLVLSPTGVAFAEVGDSSAGDYPTWAEVEAAKHSQQAAQAEVDRLEAALQDAQQRAASASAAAVTAAADAQRANDLLAAATERERIIAEKLDTARADLDASSEGLGGMVSWLYRDATGLAGYGQLMTASDPDDFIEKLGGVTQAAGAWNRRAERAETAVNTVASLQAEAAQAKQQRGRLADEADAASKAAQDAWRSADAAVDIATGQTRTMYAQLASLKGTTADVERRYQLGVQIQRDQEEQERQREQNAGGSSLGTGNGAVADPAGAQAYAHGAIAAYGWGEGEFSCLVPLWNGESGWRADALNPSSGAYGIPQSLPATKMASAGADWATNGNTQVDWGLAYISRAYGSPCNAWNRWLSRSPHWY